MSFDAVHRLARQPWRVVVVDVTVRRVEQIEDVDEQLHVLRELVAALDTYETVMRHDHLQRFR